MLHDDAIIIVIIFGIKECFFNIYLLSISTSFLVLRAPKSWSKHFFSAVFQLFSFILKFFQWFHGWNQQKSWKRLKKMFQPAFECAKTQKLVQIQKRSDPDPNLVDYGWLLLQHSKNIESLHSSRFGPRVKKIGLLLLLRT